MRSRILALTLPTLGLAASAALSATVSAAPPPPSSTPFTWEGPTPAQSVPFAHTVEPYSPREGGPAWTHTEPTRPATGTVVKVSSPTKSRATVFDAWGSREVEVPGVFEGRGPVRIVVRFAPDDFFEAVLLLPEDVVAKPVEVKVPATKSQHLIAGDRRIPVSRGVKVVTFRDDPKLLDLARRKGDDGMPTSGSRYLGPGQQGVAIRQVMFHLSGSDTVKKSVDALASRSLSTHILVGQDGTIYQAIDLDSAAYHGGEANNHSVGIDIVQRYGFFRFDEDMTLERFDAMKPAERDQWLAKAKRRRGGACSLLEEHPELEALANKLETEEERMFAADDDTNPHNFPSDLNAGIKDPRRLHPIVGPVEINRGNVRGYGPTPAAMEATVLLSSALLAAYPEIPRSIPSTFRGDPILRVADDPRGYGLVGHFHWEAMRVDPGPGFDWQALVNLLVTTR